MVENKTQVASVPYEEVFHEGPLALLTKAVKSNC
jgi:pantothenate synthetase